MQRTSRLVYGRGYVKNDSSLILVVRFFLTFPYPRCIIFIVKLKEQIDYLVIKYHIDSQNSSKWAWKDWAKETVVIKRLLKKYPFEFWEQFNITYKVKSLIWFLGGGKKQIREEYAKWELTKDHPAPILEDKPVIEIEKTEKKPSKLAEFLDLDYEKNN